MRVESPTKGQTTASEFLSLVHEQPQQSARLVRSTGWRITGPPVNVDEFWRVFDAVVAPDGSVDYTPILPPEATGPIPVASAGPAMYQAAVAVVALWGAAAAAGYQLGKDIGEALDGDDEDEPEGGDDDDGEGERQELGADPVRVELVPQKGRLRVQVIDASSEPQTLTADRTRVSFTEFLAMVRTARRATIRRLRTGSIRSIVSEPLSGEQFETTFDSVVQADGSIDPSALAGQTLPDGVASAGPMAVAIGVVAGGALAAFVVGVAVGFVVETLGDSAEDAESGGDDGATDGTDGSGDDTSDTGGGGDTGAGATWPDSSAQVPRPQSRTRFAPSNSVVSTPSALDGDRGVFWGPNGPQNTIPWEPRRTMSACMSSEDTYLLTHAVGHTRASTNPGAIHGARRKRARTTTPYVARPNSCV